MFVVKKITFLLLLMLGLSCSVTDDDVDWSSDKIIGTWEPYQEEYLPTNEIVTYTTYYDVMTFKSDGSASFEYFGKTTSVRWENLGNGTYKWTPEGIVIQKIEFVGGNEMIIYDDNSWAYYYEKTN